MRSGLLGVLLVLGGCMSAPTRDAQGVAADATVGVWIGLDDAGETWWRLELNGGARGKAAIARGNAVATYRITAWAIDANGKASVHLQRSGTATAADKFPPSIKLAGAGDDNRLRLAQDKSEVVFWREERLIRQRDLLRERMQ